MRCEDVGFHLYSQMCCAGRSAAVRVPAGCKRRRFWLGGAAGVPMMMVLTFSVPPSTVQ